MTLIGHKYIRLTTVLLNVTGVKWRNMLLWFNHFQPQAPSFTLDKTEKRF